MSPDGDAPVPTYSSQPDEGTGPWPAIVVVHETWGLNDDIRRIVDRLAQNGYAAVAPDLIDGGRLRCVVRAFRDLSRGEGHTLDTLRRSIDWFRDQPHVDSSRVGVVGFCLGGGFALLMGIEAGVSAVAPNYGRVPPNESIANMCPVVASYGGRDRTFRSHAARLEAGLREAGIPHDVKVYPDAGHSFMNTESPKWMKAVERIGPVGYQEKSAEDAWARMLAFFGRHI